jgi:hypothetical protein
MEKVLTPQLVTSQHPSTGSKKMERASHAFTGQLEMSPNWLGKWLEDAEL